MQRKLGSRATRLVQGLPEEQQRRRQEHAGGGALRRRDPQHRRLTIRHRGAQVSNQRAPQLQHSVVAAKAACYHLRSVCLRAVIVHRELEWLGEIVKVLRNWGSVCMCTVAEHSCFHKSDRSVGAALLHAATPAPGVPAAELPKSSAYALTSVSAPVSSGSASVSWAGSIGGSCRAASSRRTTGLVDLLSMQQNRHASRCTEPCACCPAYMRQT